MKAKKNHLYLIMVAAALSVILLSVAGVATIIGVFPLARPDASDPFVAPVQQDCVRCGVIESVWDLDQARSSVDGDAAAQVRYAVRVFMEDGNYRTLYYNDPPVFQTGERVKVSDGTLILR
jgi:hypothetical protein